MDGYDFEKARLRDLLSNAIDYIKTLREAYDQNTRLFDALVIKLCFALFLLGLFVLKEVKSSEGTGLLVASFVALGVTMAIVLVEFLIRRK